MFGVVVIGHIDDQGAVCYKQGTQDIIALKNNTTGQYYVQNLYQVLQPHRRMKSYFGAAVAFFQFRLWRSDS